ncbi:hypothetical protein AAC03nite_34360 [Alicyclobacillus acidoterrestris]|nr:hypothetical protein AAC03nite_34360 [Alicyclobacillus acidoterrestris]
MSLGKPRSAFGRWLDERGIKQTWLAEQSGVSVSAISALASGRAQAPTLKHAKQIIKVLQRFDAGISIEDFWG